MVGDSDMVAGVIVTEIAGTDIVVAGHQLWW